MASKKKKRQANRWFLEPIGRRDNETGARVPAKMKPFLVYDIESKDGDTQKGGFTRPFACGVFVPDSGSYESLHGEPYREFRNEPHLKERPWRRRHIEPGGCYDKLLNFVLTPRFAGHIVYAHFGGNFDHLFTLAWLRAHDDEFGFEVIPVQSSIQVLRVWRWPDEPGSEPKETWDFLDTHKLLPMALAKACKAFRVPNKLDMNFDRHEDDPEWYPYLRRDNEALALVMQRMYSMVHDVLGGEIGITTPSTSMKLFRRQFLGEHGVVEKIPRHAHFHDCQKAKLPFDAPDGCRGCLHDFIRRGYYGGRTEIFRLFGTRLHYFDINSSYVAAMKRDMPIGDKWVEEVNSNGCGIRWGRVRRPDHPKGQHAGFAEVTVYIPETCPIPPLPHKDKTTNKLIFPTGTFHGVWSLEELQLLNDPLVQGRILWTGKVVYYKLEPCFEHMVNQLWKLRDTGSPNYDPGLSELAKLLGNGLYGKFAMRQERTTMVFSKKDRAAGSCFLCGGVARLCGDELPEDAPPKPEVEKLLCRSCEGSKSANPADPDCDVWYQAKLTDAPYIMPHISAHITALARVRLWQFMRTAVRTETGTRAARDITEGDVVISEGRPHLVLQADRFEQTLLDGDLDALDPRVELVLRDLDDEVGDRPFLLEPDEPVVTGGRIYYSDSVTGDRTTVVQDPEGSVHVLPFEQLWERSVPVVSGDEKSRASLAGWKALSSTGWSPIEQILRHRSGKETHLVTTKEGQTEVTADHGIMVDGVATSPLEFVQAKAAFTRVPAPPVTVCSRVDLFEIVRGYRYQRELKKAGPPGKDVRETYIETYAFEVDPERADRVRMKPTTWMQNARELEPISFRRFYDEGSPELHALLRVVGMFVSDGSVSIPGKTTDTRYMWSICKADLPWMKQLHMDVAVLTDAHVPDPFWSDTVWLLRSGTMAMSHFWAAMCGVGHLEKKFPSFCFHLAPQDADVLLSALEKGDGSRTPEGQMKFTTTSQVLAAGLSFLLSQHDLEHGFWYRPSKRSWDVRTRPKGSARKGRTIGHSVTAAIADAWVYDLSVAGSHTFVDGLGQVLLHNTDSIITDAYLPKTSCKCGHGWGEHPADGACSVDECKCKAWQPYIWGTGKNLGEMKDEYPGERLNYLAVQPKVYLLEKISHNEAVAAQKALLARLAAGELPADEAEALRERWANAKQEAALVKAQQDAAFGTYAKEEFYSPSKLDPIAMNAYEKVTMKGFPPDMRTKKNLERLRGGAVDWDAIAKGTMGEVGPGEGLEWTQLEKVRTLARRGFIEPPRLRERCRECKWEGERCAQFCEECAADKGPIPVSKSFKSEYDKRLVVSDGSGRTRARVLNDPIGGPREDDFGFSGEQAAE